MKLYSFTAPSAGSYQIFWEDGDEPGGYTGGIGVAAYKSDQVTSFFIPGPGSPQTVSLGTGEKMLVIVSGNASGTFRIMVRPVGTALRVHRNMDGDTYLSNCGNHHDDAYGYNSAYVPRRRRFWNDNP